MLKKNTVIRMLTLGMIIAACNTETIAADKQPPMGGSHQKDKWKTCNDDLYSQFSDCVTTHQMHGEQENRILMQSCITKHLARIEACVKGANPPSKADEKKK